jgi:hypothetical protein
MKHQVSSNSPQDRGKAVIAKPQMTQRDVELVDVRGLEAMTEKRDSELIVEEREPCLES